MQIGGAEPNSDDETELIYEVDSLQSQLIASGRIFSENIENVFMQSLEGKSLAARIRKWTIRRDRLRDMAHAERLKADQHGVKEEEQKAAPHVVKEEEEQKKGVKRNRPEGGGKQNTKKIKQPRLFSYTTRSDGRPPEMSQIHVNFAKLSADYLRLHPEACMKTLIDNFNSSAYATLQYTRVATGIQRTGRADKIFQQQVFQND